MFETNRGIESLNEKQKAILKNKRTDIERSLTTFEWQHFYNIFYIDVILFTIHCFCLW
jgi:hypothetical protein